jgi:hypothetical protein
VHTDEFSLPVLEIDILVNDKTVIKPPMLASPIKSLKSSQSEQTWNRRTHRHENRPMWTARPRGQLRRQCRPKHLCSLRPVPEHAARKWALWPLISPNSEPIPGEDDDGDLGDRPLRQSFRVRTGRVPSASETQVKTPHSLTQTTPPEGIGTATRH